jgi:hypothetical protein
MQATDQQSELITQPSADGAASKEISAAAAVARVSLHGGTQTAKQQERHHRPCFDGPWMFGLGCNAFDWPVPILVPMAPAPLRTVPHLKHSKTAIRSPEFRCSFDFSLEMKMANPKLGLTSLQNNCKPGRHQKKRTYVEVVWLNSVRR